MLRIGLAGFCLLNQSVVIAQQPCQKPDAGRDVTTTAPSYKLADAPNGFFWSPASQNPGNSALINTETGQVTKMNTLGTYRFILSSVAQTVTQHAGSVLPSDGRLLSQSLNGLSTLDNGAIKVGVDSRYGGAITYLSTSTGQNTVNNFDLGRQVQVGIYAGPVPFFPPGIEVNPAWLQLGYNPIQAGDSFNNPSTVIAYEKRENLLYVKTQPKHFHLRNFLGEAYIEHWVRLVNNVVKVHVKMTFFRSDKTQYEAREGEYPCLYLDANLKRFWGYDGKRPFTNDDKTLLTPPQELANFRATEPWMAITNNDDFGVGLYSPNNLFFKRGYFGSGDNPGEFGADAGYIAATSFEVFDHNSTHEFDYELVVGKVNDIRNYVYSQPRPSTGPNYRFDTERRDWHYFNAQDTGWPINGHLNVLFTNRNRDQIKSPAVFWRGSDIKKVYVRAAFSLSPASDRFRFWWRDNDDPDFQEREDRYKDFNVVNDGQFRTYEIDLTTNAAWNAGTLRQIALRLPWSTVNDPVSGNVKIEWISTSPDGPPPTPVPPTEVIVCRDTVAITVTGGIRPDAGPDRFLLACNSTSEQLAPAPTGQTWRAVGLPASSSVVITQQGLVTGLKRPGDYRFALFINATPELADTVRIRLPDCGAPVSYTNSVYLDNGAQGGKANNGIRDGGEPGLAAVQISLYTDPNRDGNPVDGILVERVLTNAQGVYRFSQVYPLEIYLVGIDPVNFSTGRPLARLVNTQRFSQTSYGLLGKPFTIPRATLASTLLAKGALATVPKADDPGFGFIDDCPQEPRCVIVRVRRIR